MIGARYSAARDERATDESMQNVAIKKISLKDAADLQWKRTVREIRLMRHFDNENVGIRFFCCRALCRPPLTLSL